MQQWWKVSAAPINEKFLFAARQKQNQLTKPPGSLGRVEEIAVKLSAMQSTLKPRLDRVHIAVFAADHGVAEEGVSAFPQVVTMEMVRNFARGGAAISVLARALNAQLSVVNVGTLASLETLPGVTDKRISNGTHNFLKMPAMTESQLEQALQVGREEVESALKNHAQLFIAGDMGIANTTSATALACAALKKPAIDLVGPGTGLDHKGVVHKAAIIDRGLQLHQTASPYQALMCLGGFEIAAMVGAYIHAAQKGVPLLIDGFISTIAALYAMKLCSHSEQWMLFSHYSAEPGHRAMLEALQAEPLVDLNLRLGEASGAAVVVPILKFACSLQNDMATFDEAHITQADP